MRAGQQLHLHAARCGQEFVLSHCHTNLLSLSDNTKACTILERAILNDKLTERAFTSAPVIMLWCANHCMCA